MMRVVHVADIMPGEVVNASRLPECPGSGCEMRTHFMYEGDAPDLTRTEGGAVWTLHKLLGVLEREWGSVAQSAELAARNPTRENVEDVIDHLGLRASNAKLAADILRKLAPA